MTKVMTVLGTRPEIVRLSRIIPALDRAFAHVLVHTGQNADPRLRDIFFADLGLRAPDLALGCPTTSPGAMLGHLFPAIEAAILEHRPDAMLILGDTNSALSCLVATRLRVPVYHMEAGNRCFDRESPEEANRRVVDHASDMNLAYTEAARRNLLAEGLPAQRIAVTGSPLREVIDHYCPGIAASAVLRQLGLEAGGYLLASLHRQENVDRPDRLGVLLEGLGRVGDKTGLPVILSLHPRTRDRIAQAGLVPPPEVRPVAPLGPLDWMRLQACSACVISDSGTVPEEAAMLGFRAVIPRRSMERPEAMEHGHAILCGIAAEAMVAAVDLARSLGPPASTPPEYAVRDVSRRVVALLGGTCGLLRGWR